ncbi:MAG: hypothetical protein IH850_00935 [Acidobacteria bacterium]|nr:hypothetical protein [Acidobacteriota bacterium]MCH8990416.1 hypothetical protein [Acidobacteriota bacterium]
MVSESEWLTMVQLVWVAVLALVTTTAMALLLMRMVAQRVAAHGGSADD